MARTLGLRQVDDADRAFEALADQRVPHGILIEREQEIPDTGLMKQPLVTALERGTDAFALARAVPVGRGCDRAHVRRKAEGQSVMPVSLAHELSDVQLSEPPHVRRACVAQV